MKKDTLKLLNILVLLALSCPFPAAAKSSPPIVGGGPYRVNLNDDSNDGACNSGGFGDPGDCTLREAIIAANENVAENWIEFDITSGIFLDSPLPTVTDSAGLTILGPANGITIFGQGIGGGARHQILLVDPSGVLSVERLTLSTGLAEGLNGGAIYNRGVVHVNLSTFYNNQASNGGAIYNAGTGTLTVNNSNFENNIAVGGGGAIYDEGWWNSDPLHTNDPCMIIDGSAFFYNHADTGGAIFHSTGIAVVTNSTIYNNIAAYGAAATNGGGWVLKMINSTIAYNNATDVTDGAALHTSSNGLRLRNTIIAHTLGTGRDCYGNTVDEGNNIESYDDCNLESFNGSQPNTDPLLKAFGNYGGPTQTMALQFGSPAIDAVIYLSTSYEPFDQRGVLRPVDGNFDRVARADIGAYEQGPTVVLPLVFR
jgi:CSLREA domain-containing protein